MRNAIKVLDIIALLGAKSTYLHRPVHVFAIEYFFKKGKSWNYLVTLITKIGWGSGKN